MILCVVLLSCLSQQCLCVCVWIDMMLCCIYLYILNYTWSFSTAYTLPTYMWCDTLSNNHNVPMNTMKRGKNVQRTWMKREEKKWTRKKIHTAEKYRKKMEKKYYKRNQQWKNNQLKKKDEVKQWTERVKRVKEWRKSRKTTTTFQYRHIIMSLLCCSIFPCNITIFPSIFLFSYVTVICFATATFVFVRLRISFSVCLTPLSLSLLPMTTFCFSCSTDRFLFFFCLPFYSFSCCLAFESQAET